MSESDDRAPGKQLVGRLYVYGSIIGWVSALAGVWLLFKGSAYATGGGVCLLASAVSFGLMLNAVARK